MLKGLLLALVVFGHTIPESVGGSFTKWLIYGVHMPAFLFLSGYLVSVESLHRRSFGEFFLHYWHRMLLPWLVVSLAWGYTYGTFSRDHLLRSLADLVLLPQWHLWYVPVLFAMLTLAWVTVRLDVAAQVLGTAAMVGVVVWGTPLGDGLEQVDHRYFAFLLWFVLGFGARNGGLRPRGGPRAALAAVGGAGAVLYLSGYFLAGDRGTWAGDLGFVALNGAVVLLVIPPLVAWLSVHVADTGPLAFAGRHSLWIYLLHPFLTEPVHDLDLSSPAQRAVALVVTAAVFGIVALAWTMTREPARTGHERA